MPSSRRSLLKRLAPLGVVGLAGCLDGESGTDPRSPATTTPAPSTSAGPTRTSVGTTRTRTAGATRRVGATTVRLAGAVAREGVRYTSLMGSSGVLTPDDGQFVVAEAASSTDGEPFDAAPAPPLDAFSLVVDGDRFPALDVDGDDRTHGAINVSVAGRGEVQYGTLGFQGATGYVVFEVPSPLDARAATVECRYDGERATWSLPGDVPATLRAPRPSFALESFAATVREGPAVDLSLLARNTTDVAGRFLAAVYWPTPLIADDDDSMLVDERVAGGERVRWSTTVSGGYRLRSNGRPVTARVEGAVAATAEEVTVESPTETSRS